MPRHIPFALIALVGTALFTARAHAQSAEPLAAAAPVVETSGPARHGWIDVPYHHDRPIYVMSAGDAVQTADLDLGAPEGKRELRRRIRAYAVETCHAINSASADVLIDSNFDCVRQASREARREVEAREGRAR